MDGRRHFSPRQFAEVTGLSLKTVHRRLRAGVLPAEQSGGRGSAWRIDYFEYLRRLANASANSPEESSNDPLPADCDSDEKLAGPLPHWKSGFVPSA